MFCKRCGMQLPDGAMFCPGCGNATGSPQQGSGGRGNDNGPGRTPGNANAGGGGGGHGRQGVRGQYGGSDPYGAGQYSGSGQHTGTAPYTGPTQEQFMNRYPNAMRPEQYPSVPTRAVSYAGNAARGAAAAAKTVADSVDKKKKTVLLLIIIALLAAILALIWFLFLKPNDPEDTVYKLAGAIESLDQDAYLECFNNNADDLYNGMVGVAGDLLGFEGEAWSDLLSGLGGVMSQLGMGPEVTVSINNINYLDRKTCIVDTTFHVSMPMMEMNESFDFPMYMELEGRDWLINLVQTSMLVEQTENGNYSNGDGSGGGFSSGGGDGGGAGGGGGR